MKMKRDLTSSSAPAPEQLEVGEIAINAKTGILYSKRTDGRIIKWLGVPVCESETDYTSPVPVPDITFSDVSTFCCGGDSLTVYVSNLLVDHRYTCSVVDLMENSASTITPPLLSLLPVNKSDRSVIFNININQTLQKNALLKASVYEIVKINGQDVSMIRSEKIINVCCNNCTS